MKEYIKVKDDKAILHYDSFDWIPGGGENGYMIEEFDYIVDIDEIIEFLLELTTIVNENNLSELCNLYKNQILNHFEEQAQEYAIEQYKKGEWY